MSNVNEIKDKVAEVAAQSFGEDDLLFRVSPESYNLKIKKRGNKHPSLFKSFRLRGETFNSNRRVIAADIRPSVVEDTAPTIANFIGFQPIQSLVLGLSGIRMLSESIELQPVIDEKSGRALWYKIEHEGTLRIVGVLRPVVLGNLTKWTLELSLNR